MSFTQNELQSFSVLLDQKLAQQRRELERGFDQRMHMFKRAIEQRLAFTQQELMRTLAQQLLEQQRKLKETLIQRLDIPSRFAPASENGTGLKQQLEATIEAALDTQLVSLDQLISQRFTVADEPLSMSVNGEGDFEGIEVQTEIPWDELVEAINKSLDERFDSLHEALKSSVKMIELYLTEQLPQTYGENIQHQLNSAFAGPILSTETLNTDSSTFTTMQDVFASIERLEHIIESMQVTMTSNHALLSNRIYHHQQLPLERAHVRGQEVFPQAMSATKGLQPLSKEKESDTQ